MEAKETPRRILEAAADVFAEAGFAGARVDEIARRAGVNKAAIYYHIGDKEALYGRVLRDVFADASARVRRDVAAAATPEEKLGAYVRNMARTVEDNPHMAPIMLREVAGAGAHFPEPAVREMAGIIQVLDGILEEGRDRGVFKPAVPVLVHMMTIGTAMLVKASRPIRKRFDLFSDAVRHLEDRLAGGVAGALESLILDALRPRTDSKKTEGDTP